MNYEYGSGHYEIHCVAPQMSADEEKVGHERTMARREEYESNQAIIAIQFSACVLMLIRCNCQVLDFMLQKTRSLNEQSTTK